MGFPRRTSSLGRGVLRAAAETGGVSYGVRLVREIASERVGVQGDVIKASKA